MLSFYRISCMIYIILIITSFPVIGQPQFEGVIRYEILNSGEKNVNVPRKSEYYLKGHNLMVRIFMETGDEMARILLVGDERTIFMIDDVQKSAIKIHFQDGKSTRPGNIPDQYKEAYEKAIEQQNDKIQQMKPVMKATGESEFIAGYVCIKYRLENSAKQEQSASFIWLTKDIQFELPDSLTGGENPLFQFLGSSGFPLRLIMYANGKSFEMIAIRVEPKKLKDELFIVPDDYTISDMTSFIGNR
jgi:hypothetical protein